MSALQGSVTIPQLPDEQELTLSCADACAKAMRLCKGRQGYTDTWEDVCKTSCKNEEKVSFPLAKKKTDCADRVSSCEQVTSCLAKGEPGPTGDAGR